MRWSVLSFVALASLATAGVRVEGALPQTDQKWSFRPEQLMGQDDRLGGLAAVTLLQATMGTDPATSVSRRRHIEYVRRLLDPRSLAAAATSGSSVAARRVAEAIATMTASAGPPFAGTPELLLGLLGRGPAGLRSAVVDALVSTIEWEERQSPDGRRGTSATKEEVARRINHNPPPTEPVLVDASHVLWRADGKRFLAAAIAAMELNDEKHPWSTDLYLREIRSRLRIDFESPKEWAAWWTKQIEKSLPEIFADCQKRVSEESARHWRQMMQRLRETQDAERVLTGVQETLAGARALELRLAAVAQLGDFAGWVREIKLVVSGEGAAAEDPRERLLARAFDLLLGVAEGKAQAHERAEVRRAALVAMRQYQTFLVGRDDLRERVARLLLKRFEAALPDGERLPAGERRSDLVEILRTTGTLGLSAAREPIEALLRRARDSGDLEVLTTAAVALGRLVKGGLGIDTARLFIELSSVEAPADQRALAGELRRACVVALNARPEDAIVREEVRRFYDGILEQGESELRIPAILGLGTLAQHRDPGALDTLVNVVAKPNGFSAQEIIAALDAIAYVGGRQALDQFAPLLGARDELVLRGKAVYDHLWRKVVSLVRVDATTALPPLLESFQELAVDRDSKLHLECILALCREPEIRSVLSTDELDLGDAKRLHALWVVTLARARAAELLEDDVDPAPVRNLLELQKNPQIREKIPRDVARLEAYARGREIRDQLAAQLRSEEALDRMEILRAMQSLVDPGRSARERWFAFLWIEKQLASQPENLSARTAELTSQWIDFLNARAGEGSFGGLPAAFKSRIIERLDALRKSLREPAPRPPSPETPQG